MAGRKVFTSGEILTAADVNSFLMDQSVMVFADSTARSSAIPTPTEGMVTFREDQDVVEVYDGSAYKTVGGLVAVKSALKTGTFSASVASGASVEITGLTISHALSDAANKVVLLGQVSGASLGVGIINTAISADGTLIDIGDASSARTRVSSGARSGNNGRLSSVPLTAEHSPASLASVSYTVEAINADTSTQTLFINRSDSDNDSASSSRSISSLILMEVAV